VSQNCSVGYKLCCSSHYRGVLQWQSLVRDSFISMRTSAYLLCVSAHDIIPFRKYRPKHLCLTLSNMYKGGRRSRDGQWSPTSVTEYQFLCGWSEWRGCRSFASLHETKSPEHIPSGINDNTQESRTSEPVENQWATHWLKRLVVIPDHRLPRHSGHISLDFS
jgi:hypothetical protein